MIFKYRKTTHFTENVYFGPLIVLKLINLCYIKRSSIVVLPLRKWDEEKKWESIKSSPWLIHVIGQKVRNFLINFSENEMCFEVFGLFTCFFEKKIQKLELVPLLMDTWGPPTLWDKALVTILEIIKSNKNIFRFR